MHISPQPNVKDTTTPKGELSRTWPHRGTGDDCQSRTSGLTEPVAFVNETRNATEHDHGRSGLTGPAMFLLFRGRKRRDLNPGPFAGLPLSS